MEKVNIHDLVDEDDFKMWQEYFKNWQTSVALNQSFNRRNA